ncbi:MAG: DUF2459 domain-containing protein [Candidatus Cyclobacteriaceae bacterium M3_2C_046]
MKLLFSKFLFLFLVAELFAQKEQHTIYVASISWHTGLLIPGEALPDSIWPGRTNFSQFEYLEIGWGDRDFYQHPKFNLWFAAKAIFWPTKTALHVFPLKDEAISMNYLGKVVQLQVTDEELRALADFVLSSFQYTEQGKLIPLKDGIYANSQFFAGAKKYFFPKNSNVWAAKSLKKAGFKFAPILFQTTEMVLNRADNFGKIVHKKD